MIQARHVVRPNEMRNAHKILVRDLKISDHLGDLGVNWRIILKMYFKEIVFEG
jgi:hypothetical protein